MKSLRLVRIAICLGIFLNLFINPSPVNACSCVEGGTVTGEFALYEAVFIGRVVRIVDNYQPFFSLLDMVSQKIGQRPYFFFEDGKRFGFSIFFEISKSWKGINNNIIEVATGRGGGDCGYTFIENKEYLVYASHAYGIPGNYWVTSICSRTIQAAQAIEDLDYLKTQPSLKLTSAIPIIWAEKDTITLILILIPATVFIVINRRYRK